MVCEPLDSTGGTVFTELRLWSSQFRLMTESSDSRVHRAVSIRKLADSVANVRLEPQSPYQKAHSTHGTVLP
jgi:hypothetical protein